MTVTPRSLLSRASQRRSRPRRTTSRLRGRGRCGGVRQCGAGGAGVQKVHRAEVQEGSSGCVEVEEFTVEAEAAAEAEEEEEVVVVVAEKEEEEEVAVAAEAEEEACVHGK